MGIRFERKAALLKTETTYATDATPDGTSNAILLKDVDINPLMGERIPRELLRTGYGNLAGLLVGRHVSITARVDLAGAGAAGTAAAYGSLLRCCSAAETLTAATKADYTPINAGQESASLAFNHEGARHKAVGLRGNAKVRWKRNQRPEIELALLGLWVSDTSVAFPSMTTTAWKDPVPSTKANTPTFSIDGLAVIGSGLELDFGVDVAYLERMGRQEIVVRDRRPKITVSIEEVPLATKNFFAMAGGASVALAYTHGLGAGNIIDLAIPAMQIQDVQRAEEEKDTMLNISADVLVGSPDFTLSVK